MKATLLLRKTRTTEAGASVVSDLLVGRIGPCSLLRKTRKTDSPPAARLRMFLSCLVPPAGAFALLTTSAIVIPAALFAAEFWQQKPAADWSEKDCSRLVAKSPWAKDTPVSIGGGMGQGGGMGDGGRGRGGRGGGAGGGMAGGDMGATGGGAGTGAGAGRGGPNGEMSASQIPDTPHVVVRWDSSLPVRSAMKRVSLSKAVEDADVQAFYIIAVDGLQMPRRNAGALQPLPGAHQLPADQQDRLKAVTNLTPKGKEAIQPGKIDLIQEEGGKMTFRFYFPRSTELSLDDKEVSFQTRVGPAEVKQKFVLKDMSFDGKLAL